MEQIENLKAKKEALDNFSKVLHELTEVGVDLHTFVENNVPKIEFIDHETNIHLGEYAYMRFPIGDIYLGDGSKHVFGEYVLDSNIFTD